MTAECLPSGVQEQYWTQIEAAFDTAEAWAATDAVNLRELKLEPEQAMEATQEHVGTASHQDEITGTQQGKWSAIAEIRPGALGVAPDIGEMLKAAFYTETTVGGTSVTYELADTSPPQSLQFLKTACYRLTECALGGWVEQIELDLPAQGAAPLITFSGGFATYGFLYGGGTVDGIHAAPDTEIALQTGDAQRMRPGVYIQFTDTSGASSEDNGGAGYLVTAVDYDTDTITISPTLAGDLADDDEVRPLLPAQTLTGSVIGSVNSGFTIDADPIGMISAKTTFATGIKGLSQECTTDRPNRLVRGPRAINVEGQFYFLDESNKYLGGAWNTATRALVQTIGAASAARVKLSTPKIRLKVAGIDVPADGNATFALSGQARQSAAAADEFTLAFD